MWIIAQLFVTSKNPFSRTWNIELINVQVVKIFESGTHLVHVYARFPHIRC